ncbi:MAG TPA: HNH endonuclease [Candidatus Woesearchaeota archaeon]|nr:HNH endonuclease [Candidatus Woesearchaeota archaeon]
MAKGEHALWSSVRYPENWKDMKEAVFLAYGGKYCSAGIFKRFNHKGYIQVHHYVPLSAAEYDSEYYFLNQVWNLVPLCEKHHNKKHSHLNNINGKYNMSDRPKNKKASLVRRMGWSLKRRYYQKKFGKKKNGEKVLSFWNYMTFWENKLRHKMDEWPKSYLEDIVSNN